MSKNSSEEKLLFLKILSTKQTTKYSAIIQVKKEPILVSFSIISLLAGIKTVKRYNLILPLKAKSPSAVTIAFIIGKKLDE